MNTGHEILVVEDDHDIRDLIKMQLEYQGHRVTSFTTGLEAQRAISEDKYSLYILDWMLPGVSGIDLCRQIRNNQNVKDASVLMVTALSKNEDIVRGLDAGADDYVTKPFDINEFQARVRALLRRSQGSHLEDDLKDILQIRDLKVNLPKVKVTFKDEEIQLTHSEFTILCVLMKNPGTVYTRKQLYKETQGPNTFATSRTIDTHMAGLRKKLGEAGSYIETIRGIGYRLVEVEAAPSNLH